LKGEKNKNVGVAGSLGILPITVEAREVG